MQFQDNAYKHDNEYACRAKLTQGLLATGKGASKTIQLNGIRIEWHKKGDLEDSRRYFIVSKRRILMALVDLLARIDRRLRELGISERKACITGGLKVDAVRTIRRGHPPTLGKLARLARVLDVPLSYLTEVATDLRLDQPEANLLTGTSRDPERPMSPPPGSREIGAESCAGDASPPSGYVVIARAGIDPDSHQYGVMIPESLVRMELGGNPEDFRLVRIEGSTMSPVLEHGDQVIIDHRRRVPAELGLFLIDEGMGPVARWVQFIPGSDPLRYRVSGENPRFASYEVPASEAKLIGRVVWYSRRV
jgi:phage repressor protein C with HTH and peptisase S24 domain